MSNNEPRVLPRILPKVLTMGHKKSADHYKKVIKYLDDYTQAMSEEIAEMESTKENIVRCAIVACYYRDVLGELVEYACGMTEYMGELEAIIEKEKLNKHEYETLASEDESEEHEYEKTKREEIQEDEDEKAKREAFEEEVEERHYAMAHDCYDCGQDWSLYKL